jgi:predicted small lipoprotein YifL
MSRHTSSRLVVVTLAIASLAACGDTGPGNLPSCDVDESAIELSLDENDALVATWPGAHEASFVSVGDIEQADDDGVPLMVFQAGGYCSTYLMAGVDALCMDEPSPTIGGSPLETGTLTAGEVPVDGEAALERGRPYLVELSLQDSAEPTCRSFIEIEKTF